MDHSDAYVSVASLAVTAGIGAATVWQARKRDGDSKSGQDRANAVDELSTIGGLATEIAKEIVAGSDDVIAAHRAEVQAEMDALRTKCADLTAHVARCDVLTEAQGRRIADLEAQLRK